MPSRACKHATCPNYVAAGAGDFCAEHIGLSPKSLHSPRAEAQKRYDQFNRDRDSKAFYNSAAWTNARAIKLAATPWCERCLVKFAEHVHHKIAVKIATAAQRLEQHYLVSLCQACHAEEEAEIKAREQAG